MAGLLPGMGSWLQGIRRLAREHYCVTVKRLGDGVECSLSSPASSFYADPFLVRCGGETRLFVEEFHYPSNRGYITAIALDAALRPGNPQRVLETASHASFPFVFEADGAWYMLPETSRAGSVDLFACDQMPSRWRRAARLIDGANCADSILHHAGGLWYLITSTQREAASRRRWLEIHVSDSLLSERWQPHPVNRERRHAARDHGYGRNAGALLEIDGMLLRPMQASMRRYGECLQMMRVAQLTPDAFEEVPFAGAHPFSGVAHASHHVSRAGDVIAWDRRTR
jgi:hypothetical protein